MAAKTAMHERKQSGDAKRKLVSKLIRRTHLLVALFLTPWITMYGLSTLVMHHREFFTGHTRRVTPDFEVVDTRQYDPGNADDEDPHVTAERILSDLRLRGEHSVRHDANSGTLTINRHRPISSYRIAYHRSTKSLIVEKQDFGLAFFLEMLHRRHGFDSTYRANDLWAVMVDVVILAIVLWVMTGIWMWLELPKTRRLGNACLFAGSSLFAFLLLVL